MSYCNNVTPNFTRRDFLTRTTLGIGAVALSSLAGAGGVVGTPQSPSPAYVGDGDKGALSSPHFVPKAKRVIYLFQSGGPSQLELFDYKPLLRERNGEELPESVRAGQRLTGMTAGQTALPMAGSHYAFDRHGQNGAWISSLMPHTAGIVDDLCIVRSMYTDAINHDPAITFVQTGGQQPGRPAMGSWLSYGLGSENEDLPSFVVLISQARGGAQPLYARLWGNGFLPSEHQGAQFRSGKNPVLYLNNPPGITGDDRARHLAYLKRLGHLQHDEVQDPEIQAKIAQYEMAYRMQTSVPELMSIEDEPDYIFDLYGEDARTPGTYAANCLLARRLAERDVRFIQLYHKGWDQHNNLPRDIQTMAKSTDQASAALITDLKQRGLLDDTLVIWGGEFGRTNYSQGKLTSENFGRDHHPRCFSIWMAGGGVQSGQVYGKTDEFGYNIVENPVHVHDFQATILRLLGVDHERFTFKYQGRRFRLTDVHGHVVDDLIA